MIEPFSFNNESLIGVGLTPKMLGNDEFEKYGYYTKYGPSTYSRRTILIIIMSAIIFITLVALYDVFRNYINNQYSKKALINPQSHNTNEEIEKALISNQENLNASITFAVFCIIVAVILIMIIYNFL